MVYNGKINLSSLQILVKEVKFGHSIYVVC